LHFRLDDDAGFREPLEKPRRIPRTQTRSRTASNGARNSANSKARGRYHWRSAPVEEDSRMQAMQGDWQPARARARMQEAAMMNAAFAWPQLNALRQRSR
jgi:hypothetical protein